MEQPAIHFSPDLPVAEALRRWPSLIPVFIEYRMGCVGCSLSDFETVSDAVRVYRLPRQQFLDKLEQAIRAPGQSGSPDPDGSEGSFLEA